MENKENKLRGEGQVVKKPEMTYGEILIMAARAIDMEILSWRKMCRGQPEGEDMGEKETACLRRKRETLNRLYLIETGREMEW